MIRAILVAIAALFATQASAWDNMNEVIDQTNFVVADRCSGTLIDVDERLVLTNYHCVRHKISVVTRERTEDGVVKEVREERLDRVQVKQYGYAEHKRVSEATYYAEIAGYLKRRDLAVLRIMQEDIPHTIESPLLPEGEEIERGDDVYIVGNPSMLEASLVPGAVSSVQRALEVPWTENEELPMIQFSGGVFGGNSGGALYNDEGYLIGVPAAGHMWATFIGLAIPIDIVREALEEMCLGNIIDPDFDNESCETPDQDLEEEE